MEKTSTLREILHKASNILIVVHTHPDGDALGSGAAMLIYLRERMGKKADLLLPDSAPEYLGFIAEGVGITDAAVEPQRALELIDGADLIIIQDLNQLHRTEQLAAPLSESKAAKVLIDHHMFPDAGQFSLIFSEPERSSTCELLYYILKDIEGGSISGIPARSLYALMAGMTTDTNNFANSVPPGTLQMAAELLQAGVDRDAILDNLYRKDRPQRLAAFADMISSHLVILPSGISYMIMTEDMHDAYGLKEGETESLVNVPLTLAQVRMSIFLREENGLFRVSIRSKRGLSANFMARTYFHGGGHELAAGGKLRWPDDIPEKSAAAACLEEIAARFLRNHTSELKNL